jgi:hypothetical protein
MKELAALEEGAELRRSYQSALSGAGGAHLLATVRHLLKAEGMPQDGEWAQQVCSTAQMKNKSMFQMVTGIGILS